MFLDVAKVSAKHIPYKGVGPMVTDLLGGQIDFGVVALPSVQQHIKTGALRAIGMCGDKRIAAVPDIPTFVEQGLTDYVMEAWFAVIGPKGMAPADVKRIHDSVVAAFNDATVKDTMAKQGNTIAISSPEQAQRVPAAQEIPTFVEQGLPGYVVEAWFAVIGPKGMAAADVKRVHDAVVAAFADPAVKEAMAKQGNVINVSTTDYANSFFKTELVKYANLVKKAGVEAQ